MRKNFHPKKIVTVALTQTKNAYRFMPRNLSDLSPLKTKLTEIRQVNLNRHLKLLKIAYQKGVQIICLGELFTSPYFPLSKENFWFDLAEDAESGPTVKTLKAVTAGKFPLVLIASIFEKDKNQYYNTAVVIEKGKIIGKYRKSHIPHGSNSLGSFFEKYYVHPSDNLKMNPQTSKINRQNPYFPVFRTSVAKIGIMICFDRYFSRVPEILANGGAEIIFCPSVTFGHVSKRLWEAELTTLAAWNNVFIAANNRLGKEAPWNIRYFGNSFFVGPDGTKLINLSSHKNLIISKIDLNDLKKDLTGWHLKENQRPEIY